MNKENKEINYNEYLEKHNKNIGCKFPPMDEYTYNKCKETFDKVRLSQQYIISPDYK